MKNWAKILFGLLGGILLFGVGASVEAQDAEDIYQNCIECHSDTVDAMGRQGGPHHEYLGCSDCHLVHPEGEQAAEIASCDMCHDPSDQPHFALNGCSSCHPPHHPAEIDFAALETPGAACLTCHPEVERQKGAPATAHNELACNECHLAHDSSPACTDCHESHGPAMAAGDCQGCHAAHQPTPIRYWAGVDRDWCAACHPDTVETFAEQGAAHESRVGCYRCHQAHPPAPESTPTACTECHQPDKNDHFTLDGCRSCHQPHAPNERGTVTNEEMAEACFSCHPAVQDKIELSPETHGSMACGVCHRQHPFSLLCQDCHIPHEESMSQGDCLRCHGPHNPENVEFGADIKNTLCGACHDSAVETLSADGGAHGEGLGCADCHESHPPQEGSIPACSACHAEDDQPHFALQECHSCHSPHAPLAKSWEAMPELASACMSCHTDPMKGTEFFPSPHAEMGCGSCHQSHDMTLSCLDCHESHGPDMAVDECATCHAPHTPTPINYVQRPGPAQCAACHQQQVIRIAEQGASHREALECLDCHQQHPAAGCRDCHASHPQAGIGQAPDCSDCHAPTQRTHFAIGNCSLCHPPHAPLELQLDAIEPVMPACLSCHDAVGQTFAKAKSAHRRMDCLACHPEHGESETCLQCHEPHAPNMSTGDCSACHTPHAPIAISYDQGISPDLCKACHEETVRTLAEQGAAHRTETSCAACHPEHHPIGEKTIVACRECHPRLHKRHYTLEPCMPCHEPHAPREVHLESLEVVRPVCVSCHNPVGRNMDYHPSAHSEMDCRACHLEHKDYKRCLECHQPHGGIEMDHEDCLKCHEAHAPREIEYGREVPGTFCTPCHKQEAQVLKAKGMAHQSMVKCISCHREHPPEGEETVTDCTHCHDPDDDPHFAVADCRGCHNGHAPREIDFSDVKTRPACLSCHPAPGQAMEGRPSAHLQLDCAECHVTHEQVQACTECHSPHTEDMTAGDCQRCHPAHTPKDISIAADIPGSFCHGCHPKVTATLEATPSRHQKLDCLQCHPGEHGSALACDTCHGWPHEAGLHQKYPDCLKCHGDPHDLVDWQKN